MPWSGGLFSTIKKWNSDLISVIREKIVINIAHISSCFNSFGMFLSLCQDVQTKIFVLIPCIITISSFLKTW